MAVSDPVINPMLVEIYMMPMVLLIQEADLSLTVEEEEIVMWCLPILKDLELPDVTMLMVGFAEMPYETNQYKWPPEYVVEAKVVLLEDVLEAVVLPVAEDELVEQPWTFP